MKALDQIQHEASQRLRGVLLQMTSEMNALLRANREDGLPPILEFSINLEVETVVKKDSRGELTEVLLIDATTTFNVTR